MDDVIIKFSPEQFLRSTEPYDYLVSIENPLERDRETAAYRKFALKNCDISAMAFKGALKKAYADREEKESSSNRAQDVRVTEFTGQPALRCPGYYCRDNGIWRDSAYGPALVIAHPILPVKRIVNVDTGECKTMVAYRTGKVWREQIVSREVLSSRTGIVRQLASMGAYVTSENCSGVISYLADIENANIDRLPLAHSISRMGWYGKKFLPYEDDLLFDGSDRFGEMYQSIGEHGDSTEWFALARTVRSGHSIAARAMLAASFASVLIRPLKALPFFVHCWSDESGTGKTVALMLAASVWADPNEGAYVRNMNTTNVGVEMTAGFLGSLPLCLDELCLKDKRDGLEELVYSFCEGVGRSRGSRVGGIQQQQRWYNCALSTGETPIYNDSSRAGAVNRVLDLEVFGTLFADPVAAADTVRANYGFAGKQFVQALQQDGALDTVKAYQQEARAEFARYKGTGKQVLTLSLILAADRFAAEHVFHDDLYLRPDDIAVHLKKADDVDTNRRAYEWLCGTIAENNARFEPTDERYTGPIWGRLDESKDPAVCYVIASRFSELLKEHGYNDRSFLKWASRVGAIETDSQGKSTKPVRLSSLGSTLTRCVGVKMNAMNKKTAPEPEKVEVKNEDLPW